MTPQLDALRNSGARLAGLVERLTADELRQPAYPSEWTIADVMSHLGSGAVISRLRVDSALDGGDVGSAVIRPIWDEWNAKDPADQAADGLQADRALISRLGTVTDDEQARFRVSLGGSFELDWDQFVGLRLNEHALHTWDIAVALDATATIPGDAAEFVVDNLALISGFAGKPTGADRAFTVRTSAPTRDFEIRLLPESVTLAATDLAAAPDLELPAEALIRLVYGRLDPDHTPPVVGSPSVLDELRRVFPGV